MIEETGVGVLEKDNPVIEKGPPLIFERTSEEVAMQFASTAVSLEYVVKEAPEDKQEMIRPLTDTLKKTAAYFLVRGEVGSLGENELREELKRVVSGDAEEDELEGLVEFVRGIDENDPNTIAQLKRDVLLAARVVGAMDYDTKDDLFNKLEKEAKTGNSFGYYRDLILGLTAENAVILTGTMVNAAFWLDTPGGVSLNVLAGIGAMTFLGARASYQVGRHIEEKASISESFEPRRSIRRRDHNEAYKRVIQAKTPRFDIEEALASHCLDPLRVQMASQLITESSYCSQETFLKPFLDVVGYLSPEFVVEMEGGLIRDWISLKEQLGKFNREEVYVGDLTLGNLGGLSDRSVAIFDQVNDSYDSFLAAERVEGALVRVSKRRKGLLDRRSVYERAAKELIPKATGWTQQQMAGEIQTYVQAKQRLLVSPNEELDEAREQLSEAIKVLDERYAGKKKGVGRRQFLKLAAATTAIAAGAKVAYESPPVRRVREAAGARPKLGEVEMKNDEIVAVFNELMVDYEHPYLEGLSLEETHGRLYDLLNQALVYWDGQRESLKSHLQSFYDTFCRTGSELGVTPRELLYFYRVASQNIGNREGQNMDVDVGKKQILLANAVQISRELGVEPVAERLANMAILEQTPMYDTVRTMQDVTIGVHDIEVSVSAEALLKHGDYVERGQQMDKRAEDLVEVRQRLAEIQSQAQEIVFDAFLGLVDDPKQLVDELLDERFLESLGLGEEVSPAQLTNYTRVWMMATEQPEPLSHDYLRRLSIRWRQEYKRLALSDPREALRLLLLDQGKLPGFWENMDKVPSVAGNQEKKDVVDEVLGVFDSLEHEAGSLVARRDKFTASMGERELDMEFQLQLGTAVVKNYSEMIDAFMSQQEVFSHLPADEKDLLRMYLMLNVREIAHSELLVRAENQFPQDRITALPYNHEMTLNSIAILIEKLIDEGTLEQEFSWSEIASVMLDQRFGTEVSPIRKHYDRYVSGNSHHRANDALVQMINLEGTGVVVQG